MSRLGGAGFDCRRHGGWLRCTMMPGKTGMLRVGVDAILMSLFSGGDGDGEHDNINDERA